MRLLLADHFSNAYQSLRSNRMRTFLTTLGATIGIASITAILSLSAGVTSVIERQVGLLDGNIAVVRPGKTAPSSGFINQQNFITSTLTEKDYFAIQKLPEVKSVAPIMVVSGSVTAKDQSTSGARVIGTTPELKDIAGLELRDGQFIDLTTNQQTAVVGHQLSIDLFGTEMSIGKTFTVRGERFTVIGILKKQRDPINFNNVDFDKAAIIHLEAAKKFNHGSTQIQQMNVQATSAEKLPSVIESIHGLLKKSHGGEQDFAIISGEEIAEPTSQTFSLIRGITIAVAGISLLVGGIGIMNIMLVSVAERTREIGLRKAIGASNSHIIWQFLIESLIISAVGGVSGYVFGYIIAFGASSFLSFTPAFELGIVLIALGLSLLVGVIFGLYPALRASRKNPIESLRRYH